MQKLAQMSPLVNTLTPKKIFHLSLMMLSDSLMPAWWPDQSTYVCMCIMCVPSTCDIPLNVCLSMYISLNMFVKIPLNVCLSMYISLNMFVKIPLNVDREYKRGDDVHDFAF